MPISPGQAREHRAAKYRGEFDSTCKKIDEYLVSCHHWPAYWSVRNVPHWSAEIQEKILTAYQKAGWDVEFICDHRDGDCLKFAEKDTHGHLSLGLDGH